jgi:hypothetical protein
MRSGFEAKFVDLSDQEESEKIQSALFASAPAIGSPAIGTQVIGTHQKKVHVSNECVATIADACLGRGRT